MQERQVRLLAWRQEKYIVWIGPVLDARNRTQVVIGGGGHRLNYDLSYSRYKNRTQFVLGSGVLTRIGCRLD